MKTRTLWIAILLCVPAPLLLAQGGSTGTILGTVTDNSGAVIARASVDITNVGTTSPRMLKQVQREISPLPTSPRAYTGLSSSRLDFKSP